MPIELVVVIAGLLLLGLSIRVVPERRRLAVFRFGRFIGIRGPGLVGIFPLIDKAFPVDLDENVPNWRALSTEELNREIEQRVTISGLNR